MKWGYTIKKLSLIIFVLLISTALFAGDEVTVSFHNFPWKTSMEAFKARMGNPVHTEEFNGFQSLVYEDVSMSGYKAYMVAYFSKNGLEGGAYYFNTNNLEELMMCYAAVQRELVAQFGPTPPAPAGRYEELLRELRAYETCWNLPGGYVHLKVNTRRSDPVTLWISFPTLTSLLDG
ncbi:MAG: hypothetical protein LBC80_05310 [Treponema sp.]|jgi:hypothetical protein|nr:hypothetical protein [Treponema sp.]